MWQPPKEVYTKKKRAEMTEEKCNDAYSVDDARRDAEVNKYMGWSIAKINRCTKRFIAKIEDAFLNKQHRVRLTGCMYCTNEEYDALYDLESKGYRIERIRRYCDDKNSDVTEDSFYAFL